METKTKFQKEHHIYMVIFKDANNKTRFNMTYNKRAAIKYAKQKQGTIRFMSYGLYNYSFCHGDITHGWDYPTFCAQSDILNQN